MDLNLLDETKYTKDRIKAAKKLSYSVDLLEVLLEDDEEYTLAEVEDLVQAFNNREVKY